jgi:hypothetical protein
MSENEPRPAENPYGSQPPTNPYGQQVPPAGDTPGSSQDWPQAPAPSQPGPPPYDAPQHGAPQHGAPQDGAPQYGAPQQGAQPGHPQGGAYQADTSAPYGDPYGGMAPYGGTAPYGGQRPGGDQRPGTVTAAGWITIVMSALSMLLFGLVALVFLVAQDPMIEEMRRQPGFDTMDIDPGSIVGVMVAVMLVFALWSAIGVVLGIFVLRRSNVARILLVVSSAVVALISLAAIASGGSAVSLIAAIAVIVLLFVGGASDWFARRGPASYDAGPYGH